jgi:hypothetical protein
LKDFKVLNSKKIKLLGTFIHHRRKSPLPLPILEFFDFLETGKFAIKKNQKKKNDLKLYLFLVKIFISFFIRRKELNCRKEDLVKYKPKLPNFKNFKER